MVLIRGQKLKTYSITANYRRIICVLDSFKFINDADQRDGKLKNEMVTILNLCIHVHDEYTPSIVWRKPALRV